MIKLVKRFLKFLHRIGVIKKAWKIIYSGKGVSLNDFYSQAHWSTRNNIKDEYGSIFSKLIQDANMEFINEYSLVIFYNSRLDPSNVSGTIKVFEDTLAGMYNRKNRLHKYKPYVADDSKKYCKGIITLYDSGLPNNTYEIIVISHDKG